MQLKPGSRWRSDVCETEVVVVRPAKDSAIISCGGHPMVPIDASSTDSKVMLADRASPTNVGKRYEDSVSGLLVLCTKGGLGQLAVDDRIMMAAPARALPPSD